MITLRLKNIDELKPKGGGKNLLIQCSFCPEWNLRQEEIDSLADGLGENLGTVPTALCMLVLFVASAIMLFAALGARHEAIQRGDW